MNQFDELKSICESFNSSFKMGDHVLISNMKKYDSSAPKDFGTGIVTTMIGNKVGVKIGNSQINVDPADLSIDK